MSYTTPGDFELVTAPVAPVLQTCDLRRYLRLTGTEDDLLLAGWQEAAVEYIETECRRQLVSATWKLKLDCFPSVIDVRKLPVSSVTSIRYIDTAGDWQTLSASDYETDLTHTPAQIRPVYNGSWPSTRSENNAVEVNFIAGYGTPDDVPQIAKQIIYLMVNSSYNGCEYPDAVVDLMTKLYWGA